MSGILTNTALPCSTGTLPLRTVSAGFEVHAIAAMASRESISCFIIVGKTYKYKKNLQFYPLPAQSSKAVIWKPANAAIHATAMVYTQMAVAQLHLPVSFFMAAKVAMQGK